jgi:hypothetical protein
MSSFRPLANDVITTNNNSTQAVVVDDNVVKEESLIDITPVEKDIINGKKESNAEIIVGYLNTNTDITKSILALFGVLITVVGAYFIGKIARKAPNDMVKLEQLKLIDVLTLEEAWLKPERHFVVEEAFRQYYNFYIPIRIIQLLSNVEQRFYAFSSYKKIAKFTSFNQKTKKIKSLSKEGKNVRLVALVTSFISMFLLLLFVTVSAYALFMIDGRHANAWLLIIVSFLVYIAGQLAYFCYLALDSAMESNANFERFEKELSGYVEPTEVDNNQYVVIGVNIVILVFLWIIGLYVF